MLNKNKKNIQELGAYSLSIVRTTPSKKRS